MAIHRAHVLLPDDLLREVDEIAGPRGRSAFLVETVRNEVRRRKLLRFLTSQEPAWRSESHPELISGAAAFVRKVRRESEGRGRGRQARVRKKTGLSQ
jgi:hypothetical protein